MTYEEFLEWHAFYEWERYHERRASAIAQQQRSHGSGSETHSIAVLGRH